MDANRNRNKMLADTNESGYVWTVPQLHIFLNCNNRAIAVEKLEVCIDDVMNWITCKLQYAYGNPLKTEEIHFYSRYMQPECPLRPIN